VGGVFDTIYDSSNSVGLSANCIAKWNSSGKYWSTVGPSYYNGTLSNIYSIISSSSTLYFGGTQSANTSNPINSVGNIIKWNISMNNWSFLGVSSGNGVDNNVNSLVMDISNNRLYVGGGFQVAYDKNYYVGKNNSPTTPGLTVGGAAYFDTVNKVWNKLGGGSAGTGVKFSNNATSYANSLGLDTSNNALYVGGTFDTAYNSSAISANNIAKWNV
jgi:hypothetical protein